VRAPAYASGPSDAPLVADTMGVVLRRRAQEAPDGEALVAAEEGVRLTWGELDARADAVGRGLLGAGIGLGDRVAVYAPNGADWVALQLAAGRVGAVLVALNPAYRATELRYALAHCEARLLFARPEFRGSDYREIVAAVAPDLPQLERAIFFGTEEWEAFAVAGGPVEPAPFDADAVLSLQYTSGTTGTPKAAALTHHNVLNNAWFGGRRLGVGPGERIAVPVPLFHTFGVTYGTAVSLVHAATMVLPSAAFDPAAVLRAAAAERCSCAYGVPAMWIALLEHPLRAELDLSALDKGLAAGALCPPEVMRRLLDWLPGAGIGYGMTETSPCSAQTSTADDPVRRAETVGRVMEHAEVKIADPFTGRCLERGEKGEVCTRGYLVMPGYWRDPERTAEAIDERRWMHTGDLGVMDDDGYVSIVGRIKDIVIRAGENIDTGEVENVLYAHEAVAEAYVIGVPDERMGEELMAWIRVREGADLSEEDVRAAVRDTLAGFKVPRYVRFATDFPMTSTGKVQKFRLREQALSELGVTPTDQPTV
jgi:fatty-acyl-CoA synthase